MCIRDRENISSFEAVLKQDIFEEDYRQEIRKRLLLYYESQMDNRNLRESLKEMDFKAFAKVDVYKRQADACLRYYRRSWR